jgi:hypothetical protein
MAKAIFRKKLTGDFCVYCGSVADSEEHFPPKSWGNHGVLLPACRECNSFAIDWFPTDFRKRVDLVKGKLRKRYARDLRISGWTAEELEDLSSSMKKDIAECLKRKKIAQERLAWNVLKYLKFIAADKCSAQALADLGITIKFAGKP